jgi:ComF family protein
VCEACLAIVFGASARRLAARGALTTVIAAGAHEGPLRDVIHAFKYQQRRSLARPLGALLRRECAPALDGADCVVPVPLHPWRHLRRGFNQALDLARETGVPVLAALRRRRGRTSQTRHHADARHANVRRAFAPGRHATGVTGRVVVLVDDVTTTGATLDACAAVLRALGAREVRAIAVAAAELPRVPIDRTTRGVTIR